MPDRVTLCVCVLLVARKKTVLWILLAVRKETVLWVLLYVTWYVGFVQWVGISNLLFGNQYVLFVVYFHKEGFPTVRFCTFSTGFQ